MREQKDILKQEYEPNKRTAELVDGITIYLSLPEHMRKEILKKVRHFSQLASAKENS